MTFWLKLTPCCGIPEYNNTNQKVPPIQPNDNTNKSIEDLLKKAVTDTKREKKINGRFKYNHVKVIQISRKKLQLLPVTDSAKNIQRIIRGCMARKQLKEIEHFKTLDSSKKKDELFEKLKIIHRYNIWDQINGYDSTQILEKEKSINDFQLYYKCLNQGEKKNLLNYIQKTINKEIEHAPSYFKQDKLDQNDLNDHVKNHVSELRKQKKELTSLLNSLVLHK